ncbi:CHAT domain-containing protein [Vacuolonema iberomarrocanum]|uniref:CHAT domain-containing protein n=1 Tax=Vacuolonema iberomarrocanum TaxID=3454632 RepID=UPI0019FAC352|nr:tetratricopeptide repeat protein [filamentous cyanobacterium LEGE 07170]
MKFLSLRFLAALSPLLLFSIAISPSLVLLPTSALAQTETDARRAEALELNTRGTQLYATGRYEEAIVLYERALVIFREIGERPGEGGILNNIGEVYRSIGQYEQALEFYEQALVIATEVDDRIGEGVILNNIGLVYRNLGQYERALEFYEQALAIRIEMGDRIGEGVTLTNIGGVYDFLGQYEQALEFYQQALVIIAEVGDRRSEGATLTNIGGVYNALGQYERALEFYEQALAIITEVGNRAGEGVTLTNIGLVYSNLGQYERALEFYEQALVIATEVGDRLAEGTILNNIGLVYRRLGQYERALGLYDQALAIAVELGDRVTEGKALTNIGELYRSLGQYERALEIYGQALAIHTEQGNRIAEGVTLNNIGLVYSNLGQYERALEIYDQALVIRVELGDRRGEGATLNNIGEVYRNLGQYEQALEFYEQTLAIRTEVGDREGEAITLNNIGFALESLDEPELAIVFFKQSVNQWEAIRGDIRGLEIEQQQAFTERVSRSYRRLADLLLQADRVLEAQRVLDLLQVQELDEYLQDVQRNGETETGTPLRPVEQEAWQRFAVNQAQLVTLGQELRELEAIARGDRTTAQQDRILELRQLQQDARIVFQAFIDSPEIQEIVAQLRATVGAANLELGELNALQDNLQQLEQNTVALYPLVLEDRIELVLVTANAPPIRRTVDVRREDLNRAIAEFRSALQSPSRDAETPAQQLYDWLIRPIESDLAQAEAEVILYAPDGQLRYIPLVALHDGNQWVAQQWQVNNIVAASLTDINNQPFPQGFNILAAAFTQGQYEVPISTRTLSFGGLEFARQEVENLAQLIPQTEQRLNQEFDQSMILEMNDFNIIHLATHAVFNPGPPEDSFILFGDGSHVTLDEVRSWTFPNVELVVLSACETAVGDVPLGNGAEVLGLGYLMQQAGAEAAIASLWQVSDGGTQVLMDAFYAALNNGYSKAEALQRAQQALITSDQTVLGGERGDTADYEITDLRTGQPLEQSGDLAHPYYWAPFILIGNGL